MKKKMSNRRFMSIWIPIVSVMVVLAIGANIAGSVFGGILDTSLGRGERHVLHLENVANWDTEYYPQQYTTLAQAREAAERKMYEVVSEGMVLLKNDGVLPLEKGSLVTPFGRGYAHPIYNGNAIGGSIKYTSPEDGITPRQALERQFTLISAAADKQPAQLGREKGMWTQNNGSWFQPITYSGYPDVPVALEGTTRHDVDAFGGDNYILELDVSAYDDIGAEELDRMSGSTGILFISRSGNENADKKSDGYTDGTPHYLALSKNERDMIAWAKAHCQSVVLVVNSSNPVELMPVMQGELEVNAIVWAGHPGDVGFDPLADILCGEVNPSGRLVDLFATDFLKTPSFANWGNFHYTNSESGVGSEPYVEYAEGMYNGYRYYETAYDLKAAGFSYGELNSQGAATAVGEVAYPFGYGLSYTTFTQKMSDITSDGSSLKFSVTVTNTGSAAGKDVVEIYNDPPYTNGGIEKASANLLDFAKTSELAPGESETIDFTIPVEDLASYDYKNNGCYVLEAGDYIISTNSDSHNVLDSKTYTVASDIVYNESNKRESDEVVATNQFDFAEGEITYLSRADGFANYDEAIAAPATYEMSDEVKAGFENCFTYTESGYEKDDDANAEDITTGAKNGLKLADLRGVDYNDSKWDDLLDEMSIDDLQQTIGFGGYQTAAVDSIGKVRTNDCDGPASINNNFTGVGSVGFPAATLIGMTWSKDLAHDFGDSIGKMANEMNTSGWYGPAMNIHRTAFAGRNFEYYSEDGVLSGAMAANAIAGAQEHGVYAYMKHFALNDQEGNRTSMLATWSNEQAIREIYLKPFEMSVKDADCHAVMSSFNYIGNRWAGGCSELLQNVLRGEWGFLGFVETDYFGVYGYMTADQGVRNGSDLMLCTTGNDFNKMTVLTNSSKQAMRTSAKNILYTVVNSRAYEAENLNPGMAKWKVILIGADVVAALLIVGLEYTAIKNYKKRKEEEEEV